MTDIQPPAAVSSQLPWQAIIGSGARWVMTFVGSWLLERGITDPASTEALVSAGAGIAMGLAALGWSLLQKWLAAKALNVALLTPPDVPAAQATAITRLAP